LVCRFLNSSKVGKFIVCNPHFNSRKIATPLPH
jgi:hypothetical protein